MITFGIVAIIAAAFAVGLGTGLGLAWFRSWRFRRRRIVLTLDPTSFLECRQAADLDLAMAFARLADRGLLDDRGYLKRPDRGKFHPDDPPGDDDADHYDD